MINKRVAHHRLRNLKKVKTWQLAILLILMAFVSATLLRLNNVGMIERREAVVSADEAGDDSVTRSRLYDLQTYVSSHMNTDMGKGVYLEYSYKRDVASVYDNLANNNIYEKAQEVCAPQYSSYSYDYVQCTMAELEKYPSISNDLNLPSTNAYVYNYSSPVWSPDLAGWSVLICVVILIIILARITSVGILKLLLKKKYRG